RQALRLRRAGRPGPGAAAAPGPDRRADAGPRRRERGPGRAAGPPRRPADRPDGQGAGAPGLLPATPGPGALADTDLRPRLGRELRRALQHAGGPHHGAPPQARDPRPASHPHRPRPGLSLRGDASNGVVMSLTGRFSALFLAALGVALAI